MILILYISLSTNAQTALYVNINSHNEETDFEGIGGTSSGTENSSYGYNNVSMTYKTYRSYVKQIADTIVSKNAKWNFQSDWTFLQGCINYDNGSVTLNTGGLNILKWMQDSTNGHIELDPRGHYTTHNLADVAWLLKLNGVEPSLNVGGFIYDDISGSMLSSDWRNFKNGIQTEYYSFSSTNYTYTPTVMWGAAAGNHVDDVRNYGAWKPVYMDTIAPKDSFYIHDATQPILFIGNGCAGGNYSSTHIIDATTHNASSIYNDLKAVADNINNGTLAAGKFYAATVQMRQSDYSTDYIKELSQLIDSLNAYMAKNPGKMQWATLSEKKAIWYNIYSEVENELSCDSASSVVANMNNIFSKNELVEIYPNPSNGNFTIQFTNENINELYIEIFDLLGNKVLSKNISGNSDLINISPLKSGMYLCKIFDRDILLDVKQVFFVQ